MWSSRDAQESPQGIVVRDEAELQSIAATTSATLARSLSARTCSPLSLPPFLPPCCGGGLHTDGRRAGGPPDTANHSQPKPVVK
jgi:hypothetical protein